MRLIGQNILCCRVKDCFGNNKSLKVYVEESKVEEREYREALVLKMFGWMDWALLREVAVQVGTKADYRWERQASLKR